MGLSKFWGQEEPVGLSVSRGIRQGFPSHRLRFGQSVMQPRQGNDSGGCSGRAFMVPPKDL